MPEIHFAPIQGFTDLTYRNTYYQAIGSVDYYYTPYFSVEDRLLIDTAKFANGLFDRTIPQILPASLNELKPLVQFVTESRFLSVNINLGCPYPMVTRRGRGAALIGNPELVAGMIRYIEDNSDLKISMKTRLGLMDHEEIFKLLEKVCLTNVSSVIIHPRTAKQLYKGTASVEMFQRCKQLFPSLDLIYNGDITSFEYYRELHELFPDLDKWMLGRGLLLNPLLAWQIKNNGAELSGESKKALSDFVSQLIQDIETDSNDRGHALNRLKSQFFYLSSIYNDSHKVGKFVRKSRSVEEVKNFLRLTCTFDF